MIPQEVPQSYYSQYIAPQFDPERRWRLIGIIVGVVAFVLFVWWFIQVVIGRNFKVGQKAYTDPTSSNPPTNGGSPWHNAGVSMTPFLERMTADLHAINQKNLWGFVCYDDNTRQKLYWDFLGISEGFQGQIAIAKNYEKKHGVTIMKDLENTWHCFDPELKKRLEATLTAIT